MLKCRTCGGVHHPKKLTPEQSRAIQKMQMDTRCTNCGALGSYMVFCYWCKTRDHLENKTHAEQGKAPHWCDMDTEPDPAKRVH